MLGIEPLGRLIYEGSFNKLGHGVWPTPFISPAAINEGSRDSVSLPSGQDISAADCVFREDFFDPVTRIRRGRLYMRIDGDSKPYWGVHLHPALTKELNAAVVNGLWQKLLVTFEPKRLDRSILLPSSRVSVALGASDAFTLWTPIDIERISTGEDLLTLKARNSYGILPELNVVAIPESGRDAVASALDKVVDAAGRLGSVAIIDRCRDAASLMLGLLMDQIEPGKDWRTLDLGPLVKILRKQTSDKLVLLCDSAHSIARMHARCKPNVAHEFGGRPLVEADAECAVAMLGLILRELGWTVQ